jgi:hypothetical protein
MLLLLLLFLIEHVSRFKPTPLFFHVCLRVRVSWSGMQCDAMNGWKGEAREECVWVTFMQS